jgi:hypothetical protein
VTLKETHALLSGMAYAFNKLEDHLRPTLSLQARDRFQKKGMFTFIPSGTRTFINHLLMAKSILASNEENLSFIDVGCGIGTKVLLAKSLGFMAEGIEFNANYIKKAKQLLNFHDDCLIHQGDAREFKGYSNYDVIYFYCPMCDSKLQIQLERTVYEGAKEGAVLIQFGKCNQNLEEEPHLHRIQDSLYIKTESEKLVAEKIKLAAKFNNPLRYQ